MNMMKTATLLLGAAAVLGASAGAWSPAAAQSQRYTERDARGFRTDSIEVRPDGGRTYRDKNGFRTGTARIEGGGLVLRDARGYRTGRIENAR